MFVIEHHFRRKHLIQSHHTVTGSSPMKAVAQFGFTQIPDSVVSATVPNVEVGPRWA
jgi:hypothetical protein